MRLILVRHAQSQGNEQKLVQGHTDYQLSERGRTEAQLLAQRFKNEQIDRIYVSDLSRAVQTAQPLLEHHENTTVTYDARLRERNYGEFETLTKREVVENGYAPGAGTWIDPPGGEHLDTFTERVTSFLDELTKTHYGETILLISHSGFITRTLLTLAQASDDEYRTYRPPNASVTNIEFDLGKNHELKLLHCCEHLEQTRT